jgi:hypothetical protein
MSAVRGPWTFFTFNPWLKSLPAYLVSQTPLEQKLDFLSQERVILASIDFIRIDEYQTLVNQHGESAVSIERMPCTSGPLFMSWCVADPLKRVGR